MAEFKLDRFKYVWKGEWSPAVAYNRDDIVRVNGKSYVCIIGHTSNSKFETDLDAVLPGSIPPQQQPRWTVMTSGRSFIGEWYTSVDYNLGDIVIYDGTLWECTTNHTSTSFFNDAPNWGVFAKGVKYVGPWQSGIDYGHGALVRYNGVVYKCLTSHTAGASLEDDIAQWEVFYSGIEYRSVWEQGTLYRASDLVKYGGSLFRCTETHTSGIGALDDSKFDLEFPGNQSAGTWDYGIYYNQGDIVQYGGWLYAAVNNSYAEYPTESENWVLLAKTDKFRGDWSVTSTYTTGDIVQRGGTLYRALTDIGNTGPDGSSADYLNPDYWEVVVPGKRWQGPWGSGEYYSVGDVVYHLGSAYVCNFEHEAELANSPGDNGNGYFYWDLLIEAGEPGGLHDRGDLLTYELTREFTGDGSTLGDKRVAIGNEDEILSINADLEVFWRNLENVAETVYVAPHGSDEEGYGTLPNKPFRTVRYAANYIEDTFAPLTPTKIYVATGRYKEIAPISVPAGCVVMGDELRSTIIVANSPLDGYQDDFTYVKEYNLYLTTILERILTNVAIVPTAGNTKSQDTTGPTSSTTAAEAIVELMTTYENFIDFRVESGSIDPTETGSNVLSTDSDILAAVAQLTNNKEFIAEELYSYIVEAHEEDDITFDAVRVKGDIKAMLRGIINDLKYTGNHRTLLEARRYVNAVNGSQLEDLFYMRDVTGLRNMTVDGLSGTLQPPGIYELYQRPTGGSCVSLDPGWGTADDRCWIIYRSPYIQGVTNFGTGCVGCKIDGSLHDEGLKSMVTNDFTQIVSDGIGCWVLNNARAELVSMFTYYCQAGYLAETGGVIRATNGNNSYGRFGSVANGNDPNETPDACTVNNRENEAQVIQAFAGGNADEILVFEYSNAGQHYTEAAADIVGAGDFAAVSYSDFRSGAMFEGRLINTQGSGSEGGADYLIRQGFAQVTAAASNTIILSATDVTQDETEILGMRLLIIAGDGVGQYGIVDGWDPITRETTIRRESDLQLGWDHIIPGTPINTSLNSTAQYRIEPLVTATGPGFTATSKPLSNALTYLDATYSNTSQTYLGVVATLGTGETYDGEPVAAVFTVVRTGDTYTIAPTNKGAGYAPGDIITINGSDVGGVDITNDITITVVTNSDDSTNSIQDFTYTGTTRDGRFVALTNANTVLWSDDGLDWDSASLSFSGNYIKLMSSGSNFVALPTNDNKVSFSYQGQSWITRALPSTEDWVDGVHGNGKYVIIAENSNAAAYSIDGLTWIATTLPTGDDSSGDQWQAVAYGAGKYIAISGSQTKDVAYSTDGITWGMYSNVLPAGDFDWVSLTYGSNRFLALDSTGKTAYSLDGGATWYAGTTAPDLGTDRTWRHMQYSEGVFFALCINADGTATNHCATTEDGILWNSRSLATSQKWSALTHAVIDDVHTWLTLSDLVTTDGMNHVVTGAGIKVRGEIYQGSFEAIKIINPGSGYSESNLPTFTVVDNFYTVEVEIEPRIGNGVLAQPDFINRGSGYKSSSSTITITGDGYADIIPESSILTLSGIDVIPGPGVQIRIDGILDETTSDPDDLALFTGVEITDLGDDGSGNGTRTARFTVVPRLRNEYNLEHGTAVTLRSRYSQCRITGHDFLDIGTGNFEDTNYPDIYAGGAYYPAAPENEVLEQNGGRVFYVSTDQDGNFRAGELFAVEQATGIVTISAEFFELDGLTELALGGVRLGGSGAVIREFSTDPTFVEDSNNVVPTQRAIVSFLAERLSVGGENLEANNVIAGVVSFGTVNNIVRNVSDQYIKIPRTVYFDGTYTDGNGAIQPSGISGTILSQMLFFREYINSMQDNGMQ